MTIEAATEAANATLLDGVLVGLVTDACSISIQRVVRHVVEAGKRSQKPLSAADYMSLDVTKFAPSLTGVALLDDFDSGAAAVRDALLSRQSRTVVRQVVAATLLGDFDDHRSGAERLLSRALVEQGVEVSSTKSAAIVQAIHAIASEMVARLRSTPETMLIAEQAARTVLMQATLDSITQDVAELAHREARDRSHDADWLSRYRTQCAEKHGYITPPDNNKRTTVPLSDIYVPGRLKEGYDSSDEASLTVVDLARKYDRHVILGDPGGGKSTATNAIAHMVASDEASGPPFVVILREYGKTMHDESIAAYIDRTTSARYEIPVPPVGLIEETLRQGGATVLLDGLDELLDPSKRRTMSEKVELFSKSYPSVAILVTSRRVGYPEAQLDPRVFQALYLSSHSESDVEQYASKWFNLNQSELQLADGVTVDDVVSAFLAESQTIQDLRSNPLLLALLCIIYRGQNYLPRNRVGIYEKCTELLFETWDRSRGLTYDFSFDSYLEEALKHLALWMFLHSDQDGVTEATLVNEIAAFFAAEAYETDAKASSAAQAFIGFCKGRAWVLTEAGITPEGVPRFTFAHRTFMEFYAAAQLTRKYPEPEKLALQLVSRVSKNEWDTLGQLAIQLINRSVIKGAERAIGKLISYSHAPGRTVEYRTNTLLFVGRCLADLPPAPALLRLAFPRFAALVDEAFEDAGPRTDALALEFGLYSLYRQDASGEAILLSELETYVKNAVQSDVSRKYWAALFVVRSCVGHREVSSEEVRLYREVFLDGWSTRFHEGRREYETLRTAYFKGIISAKEIASEVEAVGALPLDPWFSNVLEADPNWVGSVYLMAYSMVNFAWHWPAGQVERLDSEGGRWFGSLLTEVGEILRSSDSGPLATRTFIDTDSLRFGIVQHTEHPAFVSAERRIASLIHACVLVEIATLKDLEVLAGLDHPVLNEALSARRDTIWPNDGFFDAIPDSPIKRRLTFWAAGDDEFVLASS